MAPADERSVVFEYGPKHIIVSKIPIGICACPNRVRRFRIVGIGTSGASDAMQNLQRLF